MIILDDHTNSCLVSSLCSWSFSVLFITEKKPSQESENGNQSTMFIERHFKMMRAKGGGDVEVVGMWRCGGGRGGALQREELMSL